MNDDPGRGGPEPSAVVPVNVSQVKRSQKKTTCFDHQTRWSDHLFLQDNAQPNTFKTPGLTQTAIIVYYKTLLKNM